jgi:uncharacterized protein YutE (UPF0331/DUF86 family)
MIPVGAVESIDVGNHIIAAGKLGAPTDYADVLRILGENGVVPVEFVRTLEKMAGFRNLLVHVYSEVDDRQVYGHVTRLEDFERFQNLVIKYLERT